MNYTPDPPPFPPIHPPTLPPGPPESPAPRGSGVVAWILITLGCVAAVLLHSLELSSSSSTPGPEEDRLGVMLMEMQSKYMVAAAEESGGGAGMIYSTAEETMNVGSIEQRQRFVILAGELAGKAKAAEMLRALDELIENESASLPADESLISPKQREIQSALHNIYASESEAPSLNAAERDLLIKELGWFGTLAVSHAQDDPATRDQVMGPAKKIMYFLVYAVFVGLGVGALGLMGLVVMTILTLIGKVRSRMRFSPVHHAIYAETFGIWMLLFLGLNIGAGVAGYFVPDAALLIVFIAFFSSLVVLIWPVMRGVSWKQVRMDIGWTLGRTPSLEPLFGIMGYAMALPILAVGVALTYILLLMQQFLKTPGPAFEPAGGPAHPIIEQLSGPDILPKVFVLMLASIAAPVVEETMFRGVLYRHLRSAISTGGILGSIVLSGLINSFIFAIIHPQGWVAVPALMSLAMAFSLMREWRESLVPPMIMHGVSNFIVMTVLLFAINA